MLSIFRPARRLTGNAWAEQYRRLPFGVSPYPGPWRSRPYQAPVLDAITDPEIEGVLYLSCTQGGGKSEALLNAIGYYASHDPSPIMLVMATVEMAEAFSVDRIGPLFRDTPSIARAVEAMTSTEDRREAARDTVRHKEFLGGYLTLQGANAPAGLAMRPIRVLLLDEIDRFPVSAGREGDPVMLAIARTAEWYNARIVASTSPAHERGRSWALWQRTTRAEWEVPCPDCHKPQVLDWNQVHWDKSPDGEHLPETAHYACVHCGSRWDDATRWRATREGQYVPRNPGARWAGFRLSALAVIGRRMEAMVEQFLAAVGHPAQQQVFRNTVLAEWWEDPAEVLDAGRLLERREEYPSIEVVGADGEKRAELLVPRGVVLMTAGIDTQDDRVEMQVDGWGRGQECWKLEYHLLYGDPSTRELWEQLWARIIAPRRMERGGVDYLRATGIDSEIGRAHV